MKRQNIFKRTILVLLAVCTIAFNVIDVTSPLIMDASALENSFATEVSSDTNSTTEEELNNSDDPLEQWVTFTGEGTAENPYIIDSKKKLCAIYLEPNAHYSLANDIEFEDSDFVEGGICEGGWQPIETFGGILNGNGYAISNLQGNNGGFIAYNKGTVTSVRFLNACLKNSNYGDFGVIADYNASAGVITQCYAEINSSARVTSSDYAGGIVGYNSGTVSGCSTAGYLQVSGAKSDYTWINGVGGIAGYNNGTIVRCYNRANIDVYNSKYITEYVYVAGIAGQGDVSNCRSECSIYVSVQLDYDIYYGEFTAGYQNRATCCYGSVNFSKASLGNNRASNQSTKVNCYSPTSLSTEKKWVESYYTNFDFTDKWMIKNGEPVPQNMMDAAGNCYTKISFYDEIAADGSHVGESKYVNQYGEETVESLPLTCTCDTTIWQYNDNVHYHACSCGKKFDTADHVRNSNDDDCESSVCIYCGKAMPALVSHTRNAAQKDCEDSTCIYCGMDMPATVSHRRDSWDANCEDSACIYCGKLMPAIEGHRIRGYDRYTNFELVHDTDYRFDYSYNEDEYNEVMPHESIYYDNWFSYSDSGTAKCTLIAMRNMTLEVSYYTRGASYTKFAISKNGVELYTASGYSSTTTKSIPIVKGDIITFTASVGYYEYTAGFKILTPYKPSMWEGINSIEDLMCSNMYYSDLYCDVCYNEVTLPHKSDSPACEDGNCIWCGSAVPATTDEHYIVRTYEDRYYITENDSEYPFDLENGWYTSTNSRPNSTSTFTLTAIKAFTLDFSYCNSSSNSNTTYTIYKNGAALYTVSSYSTSVYTKSVALEPGDVVTFVSECNSSYYSYNYSKFKLLTSPSDYYTIDTAGEYSFVSNGDWYTSTNWYDSISTLSLKATKDFRLNVSYYTTHSSYDVFSILKNNEVLVVSIGETPLSTINIQVSKGDVITFRNYKNNYNYSDHKAQACFKMEVSSFSATPLSELEDACCEDLACGYCGLSVEPTLEHTRNSEDKDCESSECVDCGIEMPAIAEHTRPDVLDCATTECTVCGVALKGVVSHTWDEGVVTTEPTHTTYGVKAFTCACGATKTSLVAKLPDHIWNEGVITKEPTHTTTGTKKFTCTCGSTRTEIIEKLTEHEYDDGVITTEPTHITEGVKTFTCICGETYTESLDMLYEHEYDDGVITTEPTHITEGVKTFTCICGDTYTESLDMLPEHEYDNGVITTEPTHTTEGVKTFTCTCGETYTENIDRIPHNFGAWTKYDDDCHVRTCECDEKEYEDHNFIEYVCTVCGYKNVPGELPQFVIDSTIALSGKTFNISISLKNNPGIWAAAFELPIDTNVFEFVSANTSGSIFNGFGSCEYQETKGIYKFNGYNNNFMNNITADGKIVTITLKVKDGVPEGEYKLALRLLNENIVDVDENIIKLYAADGYVNVVDGILGDVNGDGSVTNADVLRIFRYIYDHELYPIDVALGDINGDGSVTNADVLRIFRYIYDPTLYPLG